MTKTFLWILPACLLFLVPLSSAERIKTYDDKIIEGTILDEDARSLYVETDKGIITLDKTKVKAVKNDDGTFRPGFLNYWDKGDTYQKKSNLVVYAKGKGPPVEGDPKENLKKLVEDMYSRKTTSFTKHHHQWVDFSFRAWQTTADGFLKVGILEFQDYIPPVSGVIVDPPVMEAGKQGSGETVYTARGYVSGINGMDKEIHLRGVQSIAVKEGS